MRREKVGRFYEESNKSNYVCNQLLQLFEHHEGDIYCNYSLCAKGMYSA